MLLREYVPGAERPSVAPALGGAYLGYFDFVNGLGALDLVDASGHLVRRLDPPLPALPPMGSVILGAATTLAGSYFNHAWLVSGGIGMMASPGETPGASNAGQTVQGVEGQLDNAKARVKHALKLLGRKVHLDKLSDGMADSLRLDGIEDTDAVFLGYAGHDGLDTTEVDQIIRELEQGNHGVFEEPDDEWEPEEAHDVVGNADILELEGTDAVTLAAIAY